MEMYCENCGAKLEEDSNFCPECGAEVKSATKTQDLCPNCGESTADSENFCENCGTNLNAPQEETKNKSVMEQYKIPIIIIVTAAIVVFICVFALSMTAHNDSSSRNLDFGTQTVNLGNIKFEIPGDYSLVPTSINYGYENSLSSYEQSYSNGEETITLVVMYSPTSNVDAQSVVQQTGGGTPKTMMGHEGFYAEFDEGYGFYFGTGNKICMVVVSSPYVLDQIKVLG